MSGNVEIHGTPSLQADVFQFYSILFVYGAAQLYSKDRVYSLFRSCCIIFYSRYV